MDTTESGFVCQRCDRRLSGRNGALGCPNCAVSVPVVDGIPRFPVPVGSGSTGSIFDRLAPIYETPLWFPPIYRLLGGPTAPRDDRERVAELLAPDGATVLDAACGTGRFTRHAARDAAAVTGIDTSDGMLETARRYADGTGLESVTFARMSADRLWFEAGAFDRVACCWALHVFPDPSAALAEFQRVLAPGGRLAGSTIVDGGALELPGVRELAHATVGAKPFAPEAFHDRLLEAGFVDVEFDRRGSALFFGARR